MRSDRQENGYKYQPRHAMTNESLNSDIIEFINDFTLGLAIPLTENTYEGDDRVKLLCVEKEL